MRDESSCLSSEHPKNIDFPFYLTKLHSRGKEAAIFWAVLLPPSCSNHTPWFWATQELLSGVDNQLPTP